MVICKHTISIRFRSRCGGQQASVLIDTILVVKRQKVRWRDIVGTGAHIQVHERPTIWQALVTEGRHTVEQRVRLVASRQRDSSIERLACGQERRALLQGVAGIGITIFSNQV